VPVVAVGVVALELDADDPEAELPVEPEFDSRAAVRARSSWDTCLMSAATLAWAEEAWASAAEHEDVPPAEDGVVVEVVVGAVVDVVEVVEVVVVVVFPHAAVAAWRLVPAKAESVSSWDWSETSVACNAATDEEADDPPPDPEDPVVPVVVVAWDEVPEVVEDVAVVVVVAVSLASALASVAWAEASDACAESTAALSVATSSDARVWPWATAWPTETSTVLTVPDASKLRFAWLTGVMVPTESRVARTVPVPTSAVRYVGVEPRVMSQATNPATTTTTSTMALKGENHAGPAPVRSSLGSTMPSATASSRSETEGRFSRSGPGGVSSGSGADGSCTG
jgi:hypothetical protein